MKGLVLAAAAACAAAAGAGSYYSLRAQQAADQIVACAYDANAGTFLNEELWQSGNTIESLSHLLALAPTSARAVQWTQLLLNTYLRTPPVVDNCFDDHQWWLLADIAAYETTGDVAFVRRAAEVFDFVSTQGWDAFTSTCGGGVAWCPVTGNAAPYKNAVTVELFLTSAARLVPYTSLLGKPAGYYASWAQTAWAWFTGSGMLNPATGLVNDGLNASCQNNGQTTWTYNQGVLLDGAGLMSTIAGNSSAVAVAEGIVDAVIAHLTSPTSFGPVLVEPCGAGSSCMPDGVIFKGIFMRHLAELVTLGAAGKVPASAGFIANATAFITANVQSALASAVCPGGGITMDWRGPCNDTNTATFTSGLDLLTAAARVGAPAPTEAAQLVPLALGNCVDATGAGMPNCYLPGVSERECAAAALSDAAAVGYDWESSCLLPNGTYCRVRTLGGAAACPSGWSYGGGSATTITGGNNASLTLCVVKPSAVFARLD